MNFSVELLQDDGGVKYVVSGGGLVIISRDGAVSVVV
jgi:hypothetical protein